MKWFQQTFSLTSTKLIKLSLTVSGTTVKTNFNHLLSVLSTFRRSSVVIVQVSNPHHGIEHELTEVFARRGLVETAVYVQP